MAANALSYKEVIKPFVPLGLIDAYRSFKALRTHYAVRERLAKFELLRESVLATIGSIHDLTPEQCSDTFFLENSFIPSLGLNDELLMEQPPELASFFGRGLHIWQYPKQLAPYLVWLGRNAKEIRCYMEIGCRWGGMFILISEWLRKNGAKLDSVIAVDPIDPSPFIKEYFNYLQKNRGLHASNLDSIYIDDFSTSVQVTHLVNRLKPDSVFIDGDHNLKGAMLDHMLVRKNAQIIVHHDVRSDACPDTTLLWNTLKELERHDFDFVEFCDQYQSVNGNFLGIGAMIRKDKFFSADDRGE